MKDPSNIKQWKFSIVKSPPWQYSVGVLFHLQYISQNSNPTLYMSLKRERSMTPSKPSLQCLTVWTQCTRPSETAFGSAGKVIFFFFAWLLRIILYIEMSFQLMLVVYWRLWIISSLAMRCVVLFTSDIREFSLCDQSLRISLGSLGLWKLIIPASLSTFA